MNIFEQSQKHLLTEQVNKANTSFIANINTVAAFVKDDTNLTNLKNVGTISTNVDNLIATTKNMQTSIDANTKNISTNTALYNSIKTYAEGVNSTTITLSNSISNLDTRVTALENTVPELPDMSLYYNKNDITSLLGSKANSTDVYTKEQVATLLVNKLDLYTDKEKAGYLLQVGDDGKIGYNATYRLVWGNVKGTLSDQKDLQEALDKKANKEDIQDTAISIVRGDKILHSFTLNQASESKYDVSNSVDYDIDVINKPKINGIPLTGDIKSDDLNIKAGLYIQSSDGGSAYSVVTLPEGYWQQVIVDTRNQNLLIFGQKADKSFVCYSSADKGTSWSKLLSDDAPDYPIYATSGSNGYCYTYNACLNVGKQDTDNLRIQYEIPIEAYFGTPVYKEPYYFVPFVLDTTEAPDVVSQIGKIKEDVTEGGATIYLNDKITLPVYYRAFGYDNNTFVMAVKDGTDNKLKLIYSTDDCETWTKSTATMTDDENYNKLLYFNKHWLLLNTSSSCNTVAVFSEDFSTVTNITVYTGSHNGVSCAVVNGDTLKLFYRGTNVVMTTTDCMTWSQGRLPISGEWNDGIMYNGKYFLVGGTNSTSTTALTGTGVAETAKLMYNGEDVTEQVKEILGI